MTRLLLAVSSAALLTSCANNDVSAGNPYGVPQSDPYGTPPPVTGERGAYTAENAPYQPLPNSPAGDAYSPDAVYDQPAPADDIYGGLSPSAPAVEQSSGTTQSVTVERGDTLWGFSKKYGVSVDAIRRANNMGPNDSTVRLGQTILIPSR